MYVRVLKLLKYKSFLKLNLKIVRILGGLWIQTKWADDSNYMDSYFFDFGVCKIIISLVASLDLVCYV